MKIKAIIKCIATGDPYAVLNKDRKLECMIPVRPYSIVSVQESKLLNIQQNAEILIKITDPSRWLHFVRTQQYDRFMVCGEIEKNVIISKSLFKMPRLHMQ